MGSLNNDSYSLPFLPEVCICMELITLIFFFSLQFSPNMGPGSDSDDFECGSGGSSPPALRLYPLEEENKSPKAEQLSILRTIETRKTMEKATQTSEEIEMPTYPDVSDNGDANRLKAWIENLFKERITKTEPELD